MFQKAPSFRLVMNETMGLSKFYLKFRKPPLLSGGSFTNFSKSFLLKLYTKQRESVINTKQRESVYFKR